jgi:hypothetical protein
LKNAVKDFVVAEGHSADMTGSNGTAIYFPETQTIYNSDPDYPGYEESNTFMPVDFVKYNTWNTWLKDYYANAPAP